MRNHPYVISLLCATVIAIVVWRIVPKEYAAFTKLSDETTETDLAIGLNSVTARFNKSLVSSDENINGIEVYCQSLKTLDFAKTIAAIQVPGKNSNYGEWVMANRHFWQTKDTVEAVLRNIEYNVSSRRQTLTIQFTDRDPYVAAMMLDSVTVHLQNIVTQARHNITNALTENLRLECESSKADYYATQDAYADYCDSHRNAVDQSILSQKDVLLNEVKQAQSNYLNNAEQYSRQKALQERAYFSFAVIVPNNIPVSDTSHPLVYIFVFCLLAVTMVYGSELFKQRLEEKAVLEFGNIFSPWSITLIIWGCVILLMLISVANNVLDPPTQQFYYAVALWIPVLTITSFVTFNLLPHKTVEVVKDGIPFNKFFFYLFFGIMIAMIPLYLHRIYEVVSMFDSKNMAKSIREFAIYGEGVGRLAYAVVLSYVMLLVALWAYPKISKWVLIATIVCCVLCSIAIMEKGTLFFVLICVLYVLHERGLIKLRTIAMLCIGFIGLMFLFNIIREGVESDYAKNESLMDFFSMYITSPSVAFSRVRQEVSQQFGVNTFASVYTYLNRFGFGQYEVRDKLQEFVYVPTSTNVYTIMQPFFRDFGYFGVAFFAWIYGLLYGIVYRFSRNGNIFSICLYTYLVEVLVLQFYQENIFLSMVFNVQLAFFLLCCTQRIVKITR